MKLTPRAVVHVCDALGLNVSELARILGVRISTVYRWSLLAKKGNPPLKCDPLSRELLILFLTVTPLLTARRREAWGRHLVAEARAFGPLGALRAVLVPLERTALGAIHEGEEIPKGTTRAFNEKVAIDLGWGAVDADGGGA